ncbi:MAG: SDR family NAD(P)-dependent oxidoreductase [Alphaproteobacteria bacterium]
MDVKGLPAIVTGGASGLGQATARGLAAAGMKVALFDVNLDVAGSVAKDVGGMAIHCDVSNAESAAAAMKAAREKHGVARLVVSCAGVGTAGLILDREGPIALEKYARVININLIGTFNILRLAADDMRKADVLNADNERGLIVNTASVAAFEGQIGQAAYASSKGGVAALTMPASREFARYGIRVLTIAPGIFETPMLMGLPQKVQDSLIATLPFPKRLGKPSEYADMVLFMARTTVLNGEVIRMDSALRMAPQ